MLLRGKQSSKFELFLFGQRKVIITTPRTFAKRAAIKIVYVKFGEPYEVSGSWGVRADTKSFLSGCSFSVGSLVIPEKNSNTLRRNCPFWFLARRVLGYEMEMV